MKMLLRYHREEMVNDSRKARCKQVDVTDKLVKKKQ